MPEAPDLRPSGFREVEDTFKPPPAQMQPISTQPRRLGVPATPSPRLGTSTPLPDPPMRPIPTPSPTADRQRPWFVAGAAIVLFGLLGLITSWLAIPRMEDHLQGEALKRLDEAGISGAVVELDGRTATISGLGDNDAKRAEEILDKEWGIRDAKIEAEPDPQPIEIVDTTVPAPGTSAPLVEDIDDPILADAADEIDTTTTLPLPDPEVLRDLDDELADLEVRFNGDGAFTPGSAQITPEAEAILAETADLLTEFPDASIQIEGHTDDQGDVLDNLVLSQARADAVVDFLVGRGIGPSRLIALGLGENVPIATNDTVAGRSMNRRTELTVLR